MGGGGVVWSSWIQGTYTYRILEQEGKILGQCSTLTSRETEAQDWLLKFMLWTESSASILGLSHYTQASQTCQTLRIIWTEKWKHSSWAPPKQGLPLWDWELIVLRNSLDVDKQRSDLFFFSFVASCNACMLMCTCAHTQEFCRFSYFQPSYGWDRLSAPQCKWAHRQDGQVIPLEMRSMEVTYGTEMFLLSK